MKDFDRKYYMTHWTVREISKTPVHHGAISDNAESRTFLNSGNSAGGA